MVSTARPANPGRTAKVLDSNPTSTGAPPGPTRQGIDVSWSLTDTPAQQAETHRRYRATAEAQRRLQHFLRRCDIGNQV